MSKVAIQGNASGTGTFTIAAPNSNTDRTLTLPDEAGTVLTSASTIAVAQGGTGRTTVPAYFCAYNDANSSTFNNGVATKANINTTTIDNTGGFSSANNRFTIQSGYAGYYLITASLGLLHASGGIANQSQMYIYKNGSDTGFTSEIDANNADTHFYQFHYAKSVILDLDVGDYIELYGQVSTGTGSNTYRFRAQRAILTMTQLYGV